MDFYGFDRFGGLMFTIVPVIIFFVFIFVFGTIIFRMIAGAKQWKKNNESPKLEVEAVIVSKRADVSHYNHNTGSNMHHRSTSTNYYVTFEVMSGDRMEFHVPDKEYGMLAENDAGILTFQGTRYLGFKRMINKEDL